MTTSDVAEELPSATETTESLTQEISREKQALRDLDNFEKALEDFLYKIQGSPPNTPTPSNLRPASGNANKLKTTKATILQESFPENRADFKFGFEKEHEETNEPLLRGANLNNLNTPEMIHTPSNNGPTVQIPLSRGKRRSYGSMYTARTYSFSLSNA